MSEQDANSVPLALQKFVKDEITDKPIEYPERIRVSGWNLTMMGFNNWYYRTNEIRNGAPVYRMESYNLFYLIPIFAAEISKHNDFMSSWCHDSEGTYPIFLRNPTEKGLPFGNYYNGIRVTRD